MISVADSCSSPYVKNYVDTSARLLLLSAYSTSSTLFETPGFSKMRKM